MIARIHPDLGYQEADVPLTDHLRSKGWLPLVKADLPDAQHKYGTPTATSDIIEWPVLPKTVEEIAAEYKAAVPTAVTMRQARTYLHRAGMLDTVTAQVNALGGEAQIAWEYSQEVQRSNPLVAMLGFTEDQLDVMFTEASKL